MSLDATHPAWPLLLACGPALSLAVACAVDARWGEPPARIHPVVAMGRWLDAFGPRLCAMPSDAARLGGALVWLLGAVLVVAFALALDVALGTWLALSWLGDGGAGGGGAVLADGPSLTALAAFVGLRAVALGVLLKPLMSWRMLRDEVAAVEVALGTSLAAGQRQLARLVSRDTTLLDATEVREAALETLAENLNDSVVAPLFWFVLLGLPGAALYRFANTADAMWGYRDHRRWMGWWAARTDDVLSWLPARLTALMLCVAAARWPGLAAMRHEARQTPSPNGGWPMGTLALLLGVRLRKPGVYQLHATGRAATSADLSQALAWCHGAVWASTWVCAALAGLSAILFHHHA